MREPNDPAKGQPIYQDFMDLKRWVRSKLISSVRGGRLIESPNGTTIEIDRASNRASTRQSLPFDVTLYATTSGETTTYEVSVADGYVNERVPKGGTGVSATEVHKPANLLDELGDRERFAISVGQQVTVLVNVLESGGIGASEGDAVTIAITAEDEDSSHYDPPIADETAGSDGVYRYKLAVLRAADANHATPWLERFLSGSHIDHFRELPKFIKAGGTHDIFTEYDLPNAAYKTKGLSAGTGITITETGGGLEIKETGDGWWGTVEWKFFTNITDSEPYTALKHVYENGRLVEVYTQAPGGSYTAVSGTEETPGTAEHATFATP